MVSPLLLAPPTGAPAGPSRDKVMLRTGSLAVSPRAIRRRAQTTTPLSKAGQRGHENGSAGRPNIGSAARTPRPDVRGDLLRGLLTSPRSAVSTHAGTIGAAPDPSETLQPCGESDSARTRFTDRNLLKQYVIQGSSGAAFLGADVLFSSRISVGGSDEQDSSGAGHKAWCRSAGPRRGSVPAQANRHTELGSVHDAGVLEAHIVKRHPPLRAIATSSLRGVAQR